MTAPDPAPKAPSAANEIGRRVVFWAVALLLGVYVYGTGRIIVALASGRASLRGASATSVGFIMYLRLLVMLFLVYLLIRFRKHSRP
jgi:hypothetical protein